MHILKAMAVGIAALSFVAQSAQGADEQDVDEKVRSVFVKLVSPKKIEDTTAYEKLLTDAEALLNGGKPTEAYALLEPMDFEYSGNSRFDYLLGIAALDSGHPDKATLALERVLAVDQNFAGARLDMARAYFHLGDLPRAKTEFLAVLKQEPPEAARITIEKYLNAIAAAEQAKKTHYSGYVQAALGYDSNVNYSPSQSQIAVPALDNLVFTLSPSNLETPDKYYTSGVGGEVSRSYTDMWGAYGGVDLQKRGNSNMTAFDSGSLDTHVGVVLNFGKEIFRLGGTLGQNTLAQLAYRNSTGMTGDWRHSFSQNDQLNIFAQYGGNRFAQSAMQINDFDLTVIGTGMQHIFADGKTVLFSSLNWSYERTINDRTDGNKTGYGLRVGGQVPIYGSIEAYATAGYQAGRYDKDNVAFLTARSDTLNDVALGGNWHFAKFWTIRPQIVYASNNSNIPIYGFNRLDASISVRRDF